jgi:hypothetical protein
VKLESGVGRLERGPSRLNGRRLGVHLVLGLDVGASVHQAVGGSQLVVPGRIEERSRPLRAVVVGGSSDGCEQLCTCALRPRPPAVGGCVGSGVR